MSVKDTSLLAYIGINENGIVLNLRGRLFRNIEQNPNHTRRELSELTGLPVNTIAGRVNELLSCGAIGELPMRKDSHTGRMAHPLIAYKIGADDQATFATKRQSRKELDELLHRLIEKTIKPKQQFGKKLSGYNTMNIRDDDLAELKRLTGYCNIESEE